MGCALAAGLLLLGAVAGELLLRLLAPESPLTDHGLYVDDPALGWRLKPGLAYVGPNGERVAINAHGMRDPERSREKPPGARRVLVLGDSFTFGSAVDAGATYPRRLEQLLGPGVEVVNAGVPRYSTVQEATWLEREGPAWGADAIVLGFFVGNDVWENLTGTHGQDLRVENGELVERKRGQRSFLRRLRGRSRLYRLFKDLPELVSDRVRGDDALTRKYHELELARAAVCLRDEPASWSEAWTRTREALARVAAAAAGRPVVLLVIPDELQVDATLRAAVFERAGADPAAYDLDAPQRRLAELARQHGFHLVDPLEELRRRTAAGERLYLPLDSHWNGAGHALAAEALAGPGVPLPR